MRALVLYLTGFFALFVGGLANELIAYGAIAFAVAWTAYLLIDGIPDLRIDAGRPEDSFGTR